MVQQVGRLIAHRNPHAGGHTHIRGYARLGMEIEVSAGNLGVHRREVGHKVGNVGHDAVRQIVRFLVGAVFQALIPEQIIHTVAQTGYAVHSHEALPLNEALLHQEVRLEEVGFFHQELDTGIHKLAQGLAGIGQQVVHKIIDVLGHFGKPGQDDPGQGVSAARRGRML